jgi:hypothetical protein
MAFNTVLMEMKYSLLENYAIDQRDHVRGTDQSNFTAEAPRRKETQRKCLGKADTFSKARRAKPIRPSRPSRLRVFAVKITYATLRLRVDGEKKPLRPLRLCAFAVKNNV